MYDDYEFDGQESGASTIVGVFILCALILGGAVGLIWYLQGPFVGRKFIGALLAPLGVLWVLLFVGAMTATFTKQKFLAALMWIMMLGLSMLGNQSIANNLISGLEEPQRALVDQESEDVFDYAFVLGGGMDMNRFEEFDFNSAGERITEAVQLYKQGKVKHLVFTGSPFLYNDDEAKEKQSEDVGEPKNSKLFSLEKEEGADKEAGQPEAVPSDIPSSGPAAQVDGLEAEKSTVAEVDHRSVYEQSLRKMLQAMGVAESDYSFIGGRYTAEEMKRIDDFLKENGDVKSALITSAWHMPRAARLGLAQGLQMTNIPVDFRTKQLSEDPTFFIPKLDAFFTSSIALKEYTAAWVE